MELDNLLKMRKVPTSTKPRYMTTTKCPDNANKFGTYIFAQLFIFIIKFVKIRVFPKRIIGYV